MRRAITWLFLGGMAHATVVHVPLKSGVALKPGEAYTINVEAAGPTEIGWKAVQAKACTTNCVQAAQLMAGVTYSIATPLGAAKKYKPESGKIAIEYKNVSS